MTTLARMGIGGFHIADADTFSISNFNRQFGATISTIGENKTSVMERIAKDINPDLRLQSWNCMVTEDNVEKFLQGCDLVVDSIDAFALKSRRLVFRKAEEMGIPVVSAGPLGLGCAMVILKPYSMTFDKYFGYDSKGTDVDNLARFLTGIAPRPHFLRYLDSMAVKASDQRGPSMSAAVDLCAGFAAIEAMKIILDRPNVKAAPYYHYYDAYLKIFKVGYVPFGARNPIQRFIASRVSRVLRT